jgi:hypothetical protein
MGFVRQGGARATVPARKETRGGSGTGTRAKIESRQRCREKEGHTVQGSETNAAPCRGHASVTHVGPATDGFRRTQSDGDPTNVERSPDTGATSHLCSNYSRLLLFPVALLFLLFPLESTHYGFPVRTQGYIFFTKENVYSKGGTTV